MTTVTDMMSVDASLCQCPACRRRFDATNTPVNPLSQVNGRELSVCFYCGGILVGEGRALRVITYTEFDLLDEGIRAELVRKRVAILDHWRKQPLEAHPKPQCSSRVGDSEGAQIRPGFSYAGGAWR